MAMSNLPKSAARAASTASPSSQMTKAAGDISSVFPSLNPDYKPEPLPSRFKDLKSSLFQQNEKAIRDSWERLLPSLDHEVQKIKTKGSDACSPPEVTKSELTLLDHSVGELLRRYFWEGSG